jgi:hypothetical protein
VPSELRDELDRYRSTDPEQVTDVVAAILVVEVIVVGEVVVLVVVVMEAAGIFLEMENEAKQLLAILSIEAEGARMNAREGDEAENWALEIISKTLVQK